MWKTPVAPRYIVESIGLPGSLLVFLLIWSLHDCGIFTRAFWRLAETRCRARWNSFKFLLLFFLGCKHPVNFISSKVVEEIEYSPRKEKDLSENVKDPPDKALNKADFIDPRCGKCNLCSNRPDCPMKTWRMLRNVYRPRLTLAIVASIVGIACTAFTLSVKILPPNTAPNSDANDRVLLKLRSLELEYNILCDLLLQGGVASLAAALVFRRMSRVTTTLTAVAGYTFLKKITFFAFLHFASMIPALISVMTKWHDMANLPTLTDVPLSVIWTAFYALIFIFVTSVFGISLFVTFSFRSLVRSSPTSSSNVNSTLFSASGANETTIPDATLLPPSLLQRHSSKRSNSRQIDQIVPETRQLKLIHHDLSWYVSTQEPVQGCGCKCCSKTGSFRMDKASKESRASWFSQLWFMWLTPMVSLGYIRPLETSDLSDVLPWLSSRPSEKRFDVLWLKEFQSKGQKASLIRVFFVFCRSTLIRAGCLKLVYDCFYFAGPIALNILTKFLAKCQWAIYAPDKAEDRATVGSLYLEGLGVALALLVANLAMTVLLHHHHHLQMKISISLQSGLMGAVYSKSLRISSGAQQIRMRGVDAVPSQAQDGLMKEEDGAKELPGKSWLWKLMFCCTCRGYQKKNKPTTTTTGEIVNLMQVDVSRVAEVLGYIHMLWSSPLQIIISLILLWKQLGPSTIAGVAIMCFSVPMTAFVGAKVEQIQEELMHIRDERIKMTNETLAAMKIIKMYAWEDSFKKRVGDIRQEEMKKLWSYRILIMSQRVFWYAVPVFVSIASFLTYVASGHTLDAATAFTSVSLFNTLRFPLTVFPLMFTLFAEAIVGARRIAQFLVRPEVKALQPPPRMSMIDPTKPTIVAEHLTLRWPNNSPLLDDASFSCFPGTITAVIGRTGVGKSGLLASLIGDLEPQPVTMDGTKPSSLEIHGRIAYVAQTAWIMNTTLRENIVFGMPFNRKWYSKVVHACALLPDLAILPAGDLTEIGEKGVNLSGGQKQRVSLARAIYRSGNFPTGHNIELPCDIYILDDCLSAVDSHVGQHIFEYAIRGILRVNCRTVIFVTHKVSVLPMVDNIIFLGRRLKDSASGEPTNLALACSGSSDNINITQNGHGLGDQADVGVGVVLAVGTNNALQLNKEYASFTKRALLEEPECMAHAGSESRRDNDSFLSEPSFATDSHALSALCAFSSPTMSATRSCASAAEAAIPVRNNTPSLDEASNIFQSPQNKRSALLAGEPVEETAVLLASELQPTVQPVRSPQLVLLHRSASIQTSASILEFAERLRKERVEAPGANIAEKAKLTEAEHAASGSVSKSDYFAYFRGFGGVIAALAVLCTLTVAQGAQVAANWWISYWSDNNNAVDGLPTGIGVYAAFASMQVFVLILNSYVFANSTQRAACFFHSSLIERLVRAPMMFFDTTPLGRIINRFSKDIYIIDEILPDVINEYFDNLFGVIATFLVIIISTRWFAIVCVPLIFIYASIQRFYIPTGRQLQRLESILRSPVFAHFSETLDGVPTVRAYRAQERFKQENLFRIDEMQRANYAVKSCNRWIGVRLETIGTMVIFSAAVLAVIGGLKESISAGVGGLVISYALSVTHTLNWMVRMASDIQTNIISVERVQEYSEGCPQEAAAIIPDKRPPADWPQKGALELRNYQLRYRKNLPLVLKGINARIEPSEKVGVVGRTGAGKSSLLIALLRIVEKAGGFVFVDDIDVSEIGLFDLRSKFSIIPQDPILFTGTLRFNLDPFNSSYKRSAAAILNGTSNIDLFRHSDEEVWKALERSHLKPFVEEEFEGGLQGFVEEGGRNLSMGQKQLLCLARALLRHSKILLLDEATSAVDPLTDSLIQETIRTYFSDCTVLTIAHRIATIMDYDKILVLDDGSVKEFGPPMKLIAQERGIFRQLCLDSSIDVNAQY